MYTLSKLLQELYQELGQLNSSIATGGSTTTVIDTKQTGEHTDGDWNNGPMFIIETTDNAAPEGEYGLISGYIDNTGVFTMAALTILVESGDEFGFANNYYPFQSMINVINTALRKMGDMALVDTTTLDSANNQTEYPVAVEWKRRPPILIEIQTNTADANDNRYVPIYGWQYTPTVGGSTALITFDQQLPADRDLKIWYEGSHPRLNSYADVINETIPPPLMLAYAVEGALTWQNSRLQGQDDFLLQRWNDAKRELENAKTKFSIWKPRRSGRLNAIPNVRIVDIGGPNRVRLG